MTKQDMKDGEKQGMHTLERPPHDAETIGKTTSSFAAKKRPKKKAYNEKRHMVPE